MKFLQHHTRRTLTRLNKPREGTGFSMLEAVVVVGVLLALAVGGFLSYGPITNNAKTAAVKSAVSEIYTAVTVALVDGDPTTSPNTVVDTYNSSQEKIKLRLLPGVGEPAIPAMSTDVKDFIPQSESDFCLTGSMISDEKIFAQMGSCPVPDKAPVGSLPTSEPTVTASPTPTVSATPTPTLTPTPTPTAYVDNEPTKIVLKYKCDSKTYGRLPVTNSIQGTETWSDGSTRTYTGVNSFPVQRYLEAGVEYTAVFDGVFRAIRGDGNLEKCLTSVDHLGSNMTINDAQWGFANAPKLKNVPEHLPATITTTANMFKNSSSLNDPNISKWSMGNVTDTNSMFLGATSFNQPLNDWNVSNVLKMNNMFENASSFNQPLNKWNTAKTTAMNSMFHNASSFNQPLASWSTANVTDMHMMFFGAPYQQDLSTWNMDKVTRLAAMFTNPDTFNGNVQRTTHSKMTKITFKCDVTTTGAFPVEIGVTGTETWSDGVTNDLPGVAWPSNRTLQAGVTYTGYIEGVYYNLKTNSTRLDKCIRSLDYWGDGTTARSAASAFAGAINLTNVTDNIPSTVKNTANMFNGAKNFNDSDVTKWNVSNITDMSSMFNGASQFNQNLSNWNVANVTARTGFDTGSALTSGNLPKFK